MKRFRDLLAPSLVVLGVITLYLGGPPLAFLGVREAARAEAAETAGVSTLALGTCATSAAPIGSCDRCGRNVFSAWGGSNYRVNVGRPTSIGVVWSGCIECLAEVLERNK